MNSEELSSRPQTTPTGMIKIKKEKKQTFGSVYIMEPLGPIISSGEVPNDQIDKGSKVKSSKTIDSSKSEQFLSSNKVIRKPSATTSGITPPGPLKSSLRIENLGRIKAQNKGKPGKLLSSSRMDKTGSKLRDENNNDFTQLEIPRGFNPPSIKECHLNNVLRSAQRCLDNLRDVRESLSNLVSEDEHLSKGVKKMNPTPDLIQLSEIAETITIISREAFIPAHRLNQTTIALYNAEDFLRYPTDIRTFDIASSGRIRLPESSFNSTTLDKLRIVSDKATTFYNKFDGKGAKAHVLQDILFTLMRAMQDLYVCTLGCQEVFKILMYTNQKEKLYLQQFLLSLPSMERSDMLTEVQDLRRLIDELVIFLEKLSWGSWVVYRLSCGKTIASPEDALPKLDPGYATFSATALNSKEAANKAKSKDKSEKRKGGILKNKEKKSLNEANGADDTIIVKPDKSKTNKGSSQISVIAEESKKMKVKKSKVKDKIANKETGSSEGSLWLSLPENETATKATDK